MTKIIRVLVFTFVVFAVFFSLEQLAFKNTIFADPMGNCCNNGQCNNGASCTSSSYYKTGDCTTELPVGGGGECYDCIDALLENTSGWCQPVDPGNYCLETNGDRYYGEEFVGSPSVPQNLVVTESQNEHPILTWDANTEPDVEKYKIYRKKDYGAWSMIGTTTSTTYTDNDITTTYRHGDDIYYKITALDFNDDESGYSNTVWIEARLEKRSNELKDNNIAEVPQNTVLANNYPNPFNPTTTITYSIAEQTVVRIIIYDVSGKEVAMLINEEQNEGIYSIIFNAKNLSSGTYYYKLKTNNFTETKKMKLVK